MRRSTHAAVGLACGLALAQIGQFPLPAAVVVALTTEAAALLPDLDIRLHLPHRGITHSLLALLVIGNYLARPIGLWCFAAVVLGYCSHLVLDLVTSAGIPLLWPLVGRRFSLMGLRTGGRADEVICMAAWAAIVGLMLLWCFTNPEFVSMAQEFLEHAMDCGPVEPGRVCI